MQKSPLIIHNIRLGLATNSSSSHSLIFLRKDQIGTIPEEYNGMGEFGWDDFTLVTPESKLDYLAIMLNQSLKALELDDDKRYAILDQWVGLHPIYGNTFYEEGYIDHQSANVIPEDPEYHLPDRGIFEELKQLFMRDDVVIAGGNDNSDGHYLDTENAEKVKLTNTVFSYGHNMLVRKDENQDFWTTFNKQTGAKVRFSFNKPKTLSPGYYYDEDLEERKLTVSRAATPELCDIKITDWCDIGCKYCYMGSTIKGKHAVYKDVSAMLGALADMKVFEVAFGGGEPTTHPDFIRILRRAHSLGIVPNFTTKNLAWIKNGQHKEILKYAGAFAFSVDNHKQIITLAKELRKAKIKENRVNLHIVMGTIEREEFWRMMAAAARKDLRVTLLGYKKVNRGLNFNMINYDWWFDDLQKLKELDYNSQKFIFRKRPNKWNYSQEYLPTTSIDTVIAKQYESQLLENGIPRWLFHTTDGTFSAYIDSVANKMGPASYIDLDQMVAFDPSKKSLPNDLRKIYQGFDVGVDVELTSDVD